MRLEIELLSDLCTYSGETLNSYVDTDVVYDDYGLPYIPAKRIKGCIREACLELVDFGKITEANYKRLFGREGEKAASQFSLDNAYLDNYTDIRSDLQNCEDKGLTNRQNVLDLYTYTRTQTEIDENGSAKKNSLRTMRVVKRGECFCAELELLAESGEDREKAKNTLENTVKMVKHMGVARTRGLGLVNLTLDAPKENESVIVDPKIRLQDGRNCLSYTITLQSPLLLKSPQGNEARTQDYIEGAKILGVIAGATDNFPLQDIIVSNAYPVCGGKRCVPVPASIQKKKDQSYDANGEMSCVDMLVGDAGGVQMTPVGALYMNEEHVVKETDSEINYYHRRPNDKSVGRATGKDDSAFYQMESLRSGQVFKGYILAQKEQAEVILEAFCSMKRIRLGYGRNAEYGRVELKIDADDAESKKNEIMAEKFAVYLDAPVILNNVYGMITADVSDLTDYLCRYLDLTPGALVVDEESDKETDDGMDKGANEKSKPVMFLNYEHIGGFNVTWNRRKPSAVVLGKGSVVRYRATEPVDIGKLNGAFIGERTSEGYGEIHAIPKDEMSEKFVLKKPMEQKAKETDLQKKTDIILKLEQEKRKKDLERRARKAADNQAEKLKNNEEITAAVAKLLLLAKTEKTYESLKHQVDEIEKISKKHLASDLLKPIEKAISAEAGVQNDEQNTERNEFEIFLNAYLRELKYCIRAGKEKKGEA